MNILSRQSSRRTGGKTRVEEESVGLKEEDVLDSTKLKNDSGDPRGWGKHEEKKTIRMRAARL